MAFIEVERAVRTGDWSMHDLHSHSHYEIYYLAKGSRSFFFSNALYKMEAPVFLIIPPHVMHKTEGAAFERYNINVSPDYLDPFQKEVLTKATLRIVQPAPKDAKTLLQLFENAANVDKRSKYADCILKALFSYGIFILSRMEGADLKPNATAQTHMPPLVLKVIDHFNMHYAEKQTLELLSAQFFVSKATLVYNFKKYTSCSPIDFLLNVRLTKAKEMLVNTRKSVGKIAELCGFSSSNYFGLIFKQKEHLSPLQYRKNQHSKT